MSQLKIPKNSCTVSGEVLIYNNFISITRRPSVLEDATLSGEFIFLSLVPFFFNYVYFVNFRWPKEAERKRCFKNVFTNGFPKLPSVSREEIREET